MDPEKPNLCISLNAGTYFQRARTRGRNREIVTKIGKPSQAFSRKNWGVRESMRKYPLTAYAVRGGVIGKSRLGTQRKMGRSTSSEKRKGQKDCLRPDRQAPERARSPREILLIIEGSPSIR